jgi:hypothetical protein
LLTTIGAIYDAIGAIYRGGTAIPLNFAVNYNEIGAIYRGGMAIS